MLRTASIVLLLLVFSAMKSALADPLSVASYLKSKEIGRESEDSASIKSFSVGSKYYALSVITDGNGTLGIKWLGNRTDLPRMQRSTTT